MVNAFGMLKKQLSWSRSILGLRIESGLYHRQGKAITNFKYTLPTPHSDLAQESLKDPYLFDFLALRDGYDEQELEQGLINHIFPLKNFLVP